MTFSGSRNVMPLESQLCLDRLQAPAPGAWLSCGVGEVPIETGSPLFWEDVSGRGNELAVQAQGHV